MFGILWLTVWATVGEAFYDDYWFDQGDAGVAGLAWGSKKHLKHNFTESLKSFHKLYHAARERPEDMMTFAKAKSHLKGLKVYRHNGQHLESAKGQFLPLRDGAKYCTMGRHTKVDCNQCACVAGQMYMCTGMICPTPYGRPTFLSTCREGRHRKIDACNFCFCRNGHEICTNKDCNNLLQFSLRSRCPEGQRRRDSCNRCLCLRGEEYCTNYPCKRNSYSENLMGFWNSKKCKNGEKIQVKCKHCVCVDRSWSCNPKHCGEHPRLHNEYKENQCEEAQILLDYCNICYCRQGKLFCENNDCGLLKGQKFSMQRNGKQCNEGSQYKKDECNYCFCFHGFEHCTDINCGTTSLSIQRTRICLQGDTKNERCNSCYCFLGSWICTRKICPGDKKRNKYDITHNNNDIKSESKYESKSENQCVKGQTKVKDCNSCECHHGEWICTLLPCSSEGTELLSEHDFENLNGVYAEKCLDGLTQTIHCNECQCRENNWYCTLKTCTESEPEEINSRLSVPCRKGTVKRMHTCKVCHCVYETWFCSVKCVIPKVQLSALADYLRNQYHSPDGCKKDEEKYLDCNLCICIDNRWVCTQNQCDDDKYDRDVSAAHPFHHKESDDNNLFYLQPCTSGEKRRKDMCNSCYCNNEQWYCQINYCGKSADVRAPEKKVNTRFGKSQPFYEAKCRKGSKRKKDTCNTCFCRHKLWFCENKACTEYGGEPERETLNYELTNKCKIGHVQNTKCYYCVCMAAGYKCRMKKECRVDPKTGKPWLRTSKCQIGNQYTVDECNYCYCNDNGEYTCTNNTCLHNDTSDVLKRTTCEIGKTEHIDSCNYCYCNSDQIWDCTSNYCPEEQAHPSLRDLQCVIGSRSRLDACNYCYCDYDRQLICSNHSCPQYHIARTSQNCAEGERKIVDACNHCVCNSDGEWDCTSNNCPVPIARTVLLENPDSMWRFEHGFLIPKEPCVNGARQQTDVCNYCVCLNNRQFCTENNCNEDQPAAYFLVPPCSAGEPLPKADACNDCICLDATVVCSKTPCTRSMQVARDARSRRCVEGDKYFLDDGCNYCVCNGGQEFCTSRACMRVQDTNTKCNEGDIIPAKDHCNMCVCVHGKITCTNKTCRKIRRQGMDKKKSGFRFKKPGQVSGFMPDQACVEGFFYNPEDYDPKCPNICVCDRGELLCTNRLCRWREKALPPEWGTKSVKYKHTKLALKQMGCVDYEPLPSDEPCSHCHCFNNRRVCNITNCVQNKDEAFAKSMHMKEQQAKEPLPDLFCTPFTFYSPDNNRFCRNCFCLHNGLSLCLLNFCKYSKDVPHDPPESIHDMCTPGEVGYPTKCVTCKCSEHGKWVCSREMLSDCDERNCDVRDEFQMGFQTFCAACKCASKEWYCAIEEGPCSDYSDVTCPMGTFIHNPNQFCSLCLCGGHEGLNNMCFTEAKCVHQVLSHLH